MARPTAVSSRQRGLVPPHPPADDEKYLYIERNLLYLSTVIFIGSCCLIYSQIRLETHDLVFAPFLLFTVVYVLYQAISLPVNFAGRGFDLAAHQARIRAWRPTSYPAVDIYLPICGEPIELLRNTWTAAAGMVEEYQGAVRAYHFVRAAQIKQSSQTILATEWNPDWHIVSDAGRGAGLPGDCSASRQPMRPACTWAAPTIGSSGTSSATRWRMKGRVCGPPSPP